MPKTIAIIPAAGVGRRFGSDLPKQYITIQNIPILFQTLRCLSIDEIDLICINIAAEDQYFYNLTFIYNDFLNELKHQLNSQEKPLIVIKKGGATRAETVKNALDWLSAKNLLQPEDWLLVHDAIRCCLPQSCLHELISQVKIKQQGGILAIKVTDTVKKATVNQLIEKTVNRDNLWLAQTPQMFLTRDFINVYEKNIDYTQMTDEASLMENLGYQPLLIPGSATNIKITTQADYDYANFLLTNSRES